MNYYKLKAKEKFFTLLFKIRFIKEWYIGYEYLKNPPIVINNNINIEDVTFINVTLKPAHNSVLKNNTFKSTLKYSRYF